MLINSETFSGNILGIFFFFLPCNFTSIEFLLLFSFLATQYHTILQYQEQRYCDICFPASFLNDEYSIPEPVPLHPGLISRPTLAQESIFLYFFFLQFRVLLVSPDIATETKAAGCLGEKPEEGCDQFIQSNLTKIGPILKCEGVEVKTSNTSLIHIPKSKTYTLTSP